jgi:hypothetical protein
MKIDKKLNDKYLKIEGVREPLCGGTTTTQKR